MVSVLSPGQDRNPGGAGSSPATGQPDTKPAPSRDGIRHLANTVPPLQAVLQPDEDIAVAECEEHFESNQE